MLKTSSLHSMISVVARDSNLRFADPFFDVTHRTSIAPQPDTQIRCLRFDLNPPVLNTETVLIC